MKKQLRLNATGFSLIIVLFLFCSATNLFAQKHALEFDGIDDYVSIPDDTSFNISPDYIFTVEAWVYPTNLSGRHTIFSTRNNNTGGSWQLEVGNVNAVTNGVAVSGLGTWITYTTNNDAVKLNEWNHIACVQVGNGATDGSIYVNGQKMETSGTSYNFNDNSDIKTIGCGTFGVDLFEGKIDNLRLWNTGRDEQQIRDSMYMELNGDETGLQAWYKMDEGSGNTIADSSQNSNTGTFSDYLVWGDDAIVPKGDGTTGNPYQIKSGLNLFWMSGNPGTWDLTFEQTSNLEATGFNPWAVNGGFGPNGSVVQPFTGSYDGKNFGIDGLSVTGDATSENQGLFGVTKNANIKNVRLENAMVTGNINTGGLIGQDSASVITNCQVNGQVSGQTSTGGLIGQTCGTTITTSFTGGKVNGNSYSGGLTGLSTGETSIENTHSLAIVTGDSFSGGLTGSLTVSSSITNSYATGMVSGNTETGGLVGSIEASVVTNSFWDTRTTGQSISAGGSGLTTSEMQTETTFLSAGWDFEGETANGTQNFWGIGETKNSGFPFLTNGRYPPQISVESITNVTESSATANIGVLHFEDLEVSDHGICWNTTGNPTIDGNHTSLGAATQLSAYSADLSGLQPIKEHYIRPYLIYDFGIVYGKETIFTSDSHFSGAGTEANPFEISTFQDLKDLSNYDIYWNGYFIQTADINAKDSEILNNGTGLNPLGNQVKNFTGSYNGNDYRVDNITINRPATTESLGVFGTTREASITRVNLHYLTIKGKENAGGLIGSDSASIISHCNINGTITAQSVAGMVAGYTDETTITACKSSGEITCTSFLGGLVGKSMNNSSIDNSHSNVLLSGDSNIGGLAGTLQLNSTITNSYASGPVSGSLNTGGLLGSINSSTVSNSFWDTESSGQSASAGGTGITSAEMQTTATFINAGWDFVVETTNGEVDYWNRNDTIFQGYPHLNGQAYYPGVVIDSVTTITDSSAVVFAKITGGGTSSVTHHGVCWNLAGAPTTTDSVSQASTPDGTTNYSLPINELKPLKTYYVRPYVITEEGIYYGKETSFTSLAHFKGAGTLAEPYEIATLEDLRTLSEYQPYWVGDYYFKQTADINAAETRNWNNGAGFSPIGSDYYTPFDGDYLGDGHCIDSLFIKRESSSYIGLFGYLAVNKKVSNLGLTNVDISGKSYVGTIAGYSGGSISNCFTTGTVKSSRSYGGGITGVLYNYKSIYNCYSTVDVTGGYYIGGIAGSTGYSSKISRCYSTGTITSTTSDYKLGGLVGSNNGNISSCFWDTETSQQPTSEGGTGKTTSEMKAIAAYTDAGWDFLNETTNGTGDHWGIDESGNNNGYPFLAWQGYEQKLRPVVTTDSVTNVEMNNTVVHGSIVNAGDSTITQHGICYTTDTIPTIANLKTDEGSSPDVGLFTSQLSGLSPGVTYYARAYATSAVNTSYGDTISFSFPTKELLITGSFTPNDKVYDGTNRTTIKSNNLTLYGVVGDDDVRLDTIELALDTAAVGNNIQVSIKRVTLKGAQADNYTVTLDGAPVETANITAKTLTIDGFFSIQTKTYDDNLDATISASELFLNRIIDQDIVSLSNVVTRFVQTDAGEGVKVSITSADLIGTDSANYTLSLTGSPRSTGNIRPKTITLGGSFTVDNKTYDGTETATMVSNNLTPEGVLGTDEVLVSDILAEFALADVHNAMDVFIVTTTLSGADSHNYAVSLNGAPASTGDITPVELSISGSFIPKNKVYNGVTAASIASNSLLLSGIIENDDVALSYITTAFAQADVNTNIGVSIIEAFLAGPDADNYTLSLTDAPTASGNIIPKELTIGGSFMVDSKTYDNTTSASISSNGLFLDGIVGTDEVTMTGLEALFSQSEAGNGITVSVSQVSLAGTDMANYSVTLAGAPVTTANIYPQELTISGSFTVENKVYDGSSNATISQNSLTLTGIIGSDAVTLSHVKVEFSQSMVGNGLTITLSDADLGGTDASNYALSLTEAPQTTADITPKPLTISGSFSVNDKPYDGTTNASMAGNSLTLYGIEGSDNVSLSGLSVDFSQADIGTNLNVSITGASLTGPDAQNYSLSLTGAPNQLASIKPKELTIAGRFTVSSKPYDGIKTAHIKNNNLELNGIINSEDVVLTNIQTEYARIDAGEGIPVTIVNAILDGNDAGNYSLSVGEAPMSSGNITTNELTIKGGFTVGNKDYDGTTSALIADNNLEIEGLAENHNVELTNVEVEFNHADVGTDIIVSIINAEISGVDMDNYTLSLNNAPTTNGTINPITLTITGTFIAAEKVYDGTTSASIKDENLSLEGVLENHVVGITDIEIEFRGLSAGNNIEVFISSASLLGRDAAKYVVSLEESPTSFANIEPKQLTIVGSFSAESKICDGTKSVNILINDIGIEGVIEGDQVIPGDIEAEFNQSEPGSNIMVSITEAHISGNESSNYIVSLTDAPVAMADIIAEYVLTIFTKGNGLVNVNNEPYSNEITVTEGTTINLEAIADEDWQFNGWSGDWTTQNASESFLIDNDMTITAEFSITTDVNDNISVMDIAIWPNPFSELINIECNTKLASIMVVNTNGEVVFKTNTPASVIILDELATGTYLMIIEDKDGNRLTKKILKK